MSQLLLLFNHELTLVQKADARQRLGVETFLSPPEEIRALWCQIPPELDHLADYLASVQQWLQTHGKPGDAILIQGDFGACFYMAQAAFSLGLIPVYATTRREAVETPMPDGSIQLTHRFRHAGFRRYERFIEEDSAERTLLRPKAEKPVLLQQPS
ncbi:CRISPR-associated protein Csx20 [Desulfatirhabdium butyrativorans]|uniref:CRISPR-associated protein Csx20 n=1 Tax=Desulfatirhabdium butyrativorans TaxID=340467 RepID=UPI0003FC94ED|nr:CRISPR-associated protein Csx20 [Desulfatirhabdium butyrativorans]